MLAKLRQAKESMHRFIRRIDFLRALFQTKNDNIVIAQWPNWPLWIAIALFIVNLFVTGGAQHTVIFAYLGFILLWAFMELLAGVNLFRHLLGGAVIIMEVIALIKL